MPADPGCDHDWIDAVGVELFVDLDNRDAHVVVCRLCGSYTVGESTEN